MSTTDKLSMIQALKALCPLDGRYAAKVHDISGIFSEASFISKRVEVEIEWFLTIFPFMKNENDPDLTKNDIDFLTRITKDSSNVEELIRVKEIESVTNHDVKAIELYIKEKFAAHKNDYPVLFKFSELIHFGLTSEDCNNCAQGMMMKEGIKFVQEKMTYLLMILKEKAETNANYPMMAHTHGQGATPTTVGKDFANAHYRLDKALDTLMKIEICGKMNGAVGNYNAMVAAVPDIHWPTVEKSCIEKLGLVHNPMTTQVEPHDYMVQVFNAISSIALIIEDLSVNMWLLISKDYFKLAVVKNEVGSSTMPHKVNPINFENAEGNCQMVTILGQGLARVVPKSRMHRDLSGSTVLRNNGMPFGYLILAIASIIDGLKRISPNLLKINEDLTSHPELISEAIQTVMRKYKMTGAYEKMKELTRGQQITIELLRNFITTIKDELSEEDYSYLMTLTPQTYIGLAPILSTKFM